MGQANAARYNTIVGLPASVLTTCADRQGPAQVVTQLPFFSLSLSVAVRRPSGRRLAFDPVINLNLGARRTDPDSWITNRRTRQKRNTALDSENSRTYLRSHGR